MQLIIKRILVHSCRMEALRIQPITTLWSVSPTYKIMYQTGISIKRSFYNQTGDFQFNANLIVDNLAGVLNIGVSGAGPNINFQCISGKIYDNTGNFFGVYYPNEQFSISGNVTHNSFDYFWNGGPAAYGISKATGGL